MDCQRLCDRLDEKLRTDAYADLDASANGLQIGPADREIDHVAFAVDGAVETIEEAAERGADLLVTHHGISWGGIERVTGRQYDQIAAAIEHDVALYTSHLPLDGHQELGNAAGIAELLGLEDRSPFGTLGGEYVGQQGTLVDPIELSAVCDRLRPELDTGTGQLRTLEFGPAEISDVAIITGSGVDWLGEAADAGVDLLVTGEGKQQAYHEASELGVNVVLAGHYATETFGVESLEGVVAEWGLETSFIDCPTGL
jgi:dinuclear metal center YbgI/SA1388 family protein